MKIKLNAGDDTPSIDIDSATVTIEDAFTGVGFLNADKDEILVVALRDNGFEFYYYDSIGQFKVNQQRLAGALRYGELRMLGHHSVVVSNSNDSSAKTATDATEEVNNATPRYNH